ncbi:hypothetical protein ACTFIY_004554 [Dictyostelium cf. discoideum]
MRSKELSREEDDYASCSAAVQSQRGRLYTGSSTDCRLLSKTFRARPSAWILPSLEEEEDEQEALLSSFTCEDPEEEIERNILLDCIQRVKELNELMRYISGRIGQFLQG